MTNKALFAAGCFWGIQYYFDQIHEVVNSTVGYTGGHTEQPTYEKVCTGNTGHAEALLIEFDQNLVSYEILVKHFFRLHDPTQINRQGPDVGNQYRSAIFYFDENQKRIASKVRDEIQKSTRYQVVTEIDKVSTFYPAESYHQKFTERTGRGACHISYQQLT